MNKYEQTATDTKKKNSKRELVFVNYNIRGHQVRIITDSGSKTISRDAAISLAEKDGLDLVQISYDRNARMPVCKIIDYGKFKYEQSKREKEAKKQARANAVDVKTVQFSLTTDDGDKTRLIRQARDFISNGDKVKLTIRFRNRRESANMEFVKKVMREIIQSFEDIAMLDSNPALNGREFACVIRKAK